MTKIGTTCMVNRESSVVVRRYGGKWRLLGMKMERRERGGERASS